MGTLFIHGDGREPGWEGAAKVRPLMCTQSCHRALVGLSFPDTHRDGDAAASSQIPHPCPPGAWTRLQPPSRPFGMEMGEEPSPPGAEPLLCCHPASHWGGDRRCPPQPQRRSPATRTSSRMAFAQRQVTSLLTQGLWHPPRTGSGTKSRPAKRSIPSAGAARRAHFPGYPKSSPSTKKGCFK